ncbi:tail fiber assembly protein [Pseudomonas sp. EL_65y_Pfl2_R96]|uniref:tail fiber assembly protein n=1 Tax=Pseudomonas sp. EL_65y_Pfl2_R96 TaxID=3088699 RepID=UPI0030DA6890
MRIFARIENGIVIELFPPVPTPPELLEILPEDGDIRPIFGYPLEVWQEVTGLDPEPQQNWTFSDGVFTEPAPHIPTPAEMLAAQSLKLQLATQLAAAQKTALANRISVLTDAIDLEMATPEEEAELVLRSAQLKQWKTYAILLGRVTTQAGWPPDVDWPVEPAGRMDLTVSAAAPPNA